MQREFLRFIFSAEGQRLVVPAGFYPVSAAMARRELQKIGLMP